ACSNGLSVLLSMRVRAAFLFGRAADQTVRWGRRMVRRPRAWEPLLGEAADLVLDLVPVFDGEPALADQRIGAGLELRRIVLGALVELGELLVGERHVVAREGAEHALASVGHDEGAGGHL